MYNIDSYHEMRKQTFQRAQYELKIVAKNHSFLHIKIHYGEVSDIKIAH